jgi:hypothetical protein
VINVLGVLAVFQRCQVACFLQEQLEIDTQMTLHNFNTLQPAHEKRILSSVSLSTTASVI